MLLRLKRYFVLIALNVLKTLTHIDASRQTAGVRLLLSQIMMDIPL